MRCGPGPQRYQPRRGRHHRSRRAGHSQGACSQAQSTSSAAAASALASKHYRSLISGQLSMLARWGASRANGNHTNPNSSRSQRPKRHTPHTARLHTLCTGRRWDFRFCAFRQQLQSISSKSPRAGDSETQCAQLLAAAVLLLARVVERTSRRRAVCIECNLSAAGEREPRLHVSVGWRRACARRLSERRLVSARPPTRLAFRFLRVQARRS